MLWLKALIKTSTHTQKKNCATENWFPYDYKDKNFLASPQQKTPWPVFQDGRCNTSPPQLIHTMLPLILSPRHHSLRATSGYHYLVSGTISPPYRGTFQLSLTVLLRYRSWEVFRIRSYCLPHSDPISNGPYSRKKITQKNLTTSMIYGTITLYG